jgi:hypothetical protein
MTADIHFNRSESRFILVRYGRNLDGLSVTVGDFVIFDWAGFRERGLAAVEQAMTDYHEVRKTVPSQFDKMSSHERRAFLRENIGFSVSLRSSGVWWIDLMRLVGDASLPVLLGPPYRVEFAPSEGEERFFKALLGLIPTDKSDGET